MIASGNRVVLAAHDQQQRPRSSFSVATLAGEWREKLATAASNSGLPGAGLSTASYRGVRLLLRERVAEAVPELLGGQRHGPVLVGRVLEDRQRRVQRRQRQRQNALDLGGVDRDRRADRSPSRAASRRSFRRRSGRSRIGRRSRATICDVALGDIVDAEVGDQGRVARVSSTVGGSPGHPGAIGA